MMKFLSLYIVRLSRPSPKSSVESPGRGPYWSFGFLITCVRSGFSASQLSSLHRLTSWESLLTEAHLTAAAGSGSFLPGLMREGGGPSHAQLRISSTHYQVKHQKAFGEFCLAHSRFRALYKVRE